MCKLDSIPIPNQDVVSHIVDDQAVVIIPKHGDVKVFNQIGTQIWELINGKRTVGNIANTIYDEFEIDKKTAEVDTLAFISEILKKDLISLK